MNVSLLPDIETRTKLGALDLAEYVSVSPSGSEKLSETSLFRLSPTVMLVTSCIPRRTTGARLLGGRNVVVNLKLCDAVRPPGSVAVTVTVATPSTPDVTFRWLPVTETAAKKALVVFAVY